MQYFFNVATDVYDPVAAGQIIRKFSTFFNPGALNDTQKFLRLKEATEVLKVKLETVRAGKISEAVDNLTDEALQSIARQIKSSQTAILDIELNQINQKLYIYSPRPTGPGKGGFENIATLEKRDNTDLLIIKDNEFYPLDQFSNLSGTKIQADHIISSRGEYLENVELVTKEDGTIVFRAAVDGIRNQLKAIGASDQLITRIKSIDQAQVLTDDLLENRQLLGFFERRVNGVEAWEFAFDCPPGVRTNTTILESLSNAIQRGAVNILPNSSLTEITETTISHILRGNPIGHGNPTGGFHHITALIKRTDVKLIDVTPVGTHGCYKAKLEFPNGNKPPKDFFPDDWNEAKVLSEIESAFVSPDKIPRPDLGSNTFTSVTDSGVPVYIQMNGSTMKSAFPYYE